MRSWWTRKAPPIDKEVAMSTLKKLLLTMVLILTGLLAGLQTLMLMGVLPAMVRMPLATYAGMWQTLDHFMAVRMAIFANGTLLVYLVVIGCFARPPRKSMFWSLLGCFALLATDTVFTVMQQLPINRAVQALDVVHLTDFSRVQQLRDATIQHFHVRGWLAIAAFVWLASAVIFSPTNPQFASSKGPQS
jgi:hypothetical protein